MPEGGVTPAASASAASGAGYEAQVLATTPAIDNSGWPASTVGQSSNRYGAMLTDSPSIQGSGSRTYQLSPLLAGTWELAMTFNAFPSSGIVTVDVSADGGNTWTTIATVDQYNASNNVATRALVPGIVLPATAAYQLRVSNPTKNVASSAYAIELSTLELVWTGA